MLQDDIECVLNLEQRLGDHIFGQRNAIKEISQAIRIARAGIQSQERPLIFLLAGQPVRAKQKRPMYWSKPCMAVLITLLPSI